MGNLKMAELLGFAWCGIKCCYSLDGIYFCSVYL